MTNPFMGGTFPGTSDQQGPSRPPPRPPAKEATPRIENNAFTALDPLGDKEKKIGKDMFKDFQLAKPPAIPARKGEAGSNTAGAFDEYFSNKVGLAQDSADHDDFDINHLSTVNGKPALAKLSSAYRQNLVTSVTKRFFCRCVKMFLNQLLLRLQLQTLQLLPMRTSQTIRTCLIKHLGPQIPVHSEFLL